jgi:hypothetical protein
MHKVTTHEEMIVADLKQKVNIDIDIDILIGGIIIIENGASVRRFWNSLSVSFLFLWTMEDGA